MADASSIHAPRGIRTEIVTSALMSSREVFIGISVLRSDGDVTTRFSSTCPSSTKPLPDVDPDADG